MTPAARTRTKICGITSPEDARAAEHAGADYVGAVLVPGSPRRVGPPEARAIAGSVGIPLVVVVPASDAGAAAGIARDAGARVVQLHGPGSAHDVGRLGELGEWELWRVVRVRSREDVEDAVRSWGPLVDLLLLDAWSPSGLGGTGTRFPWSALEEARDGVPPGLRLGVAGGLTPDNVSEAVRRLAPDLVDVSSGVERAPGSKDPDRIRAFVANATRRSPGPGAPRNTRPQEDRST